MYFENVPCMAIYIMKIGVWNGSQTMWDSFQTSIYNAETWLSSFLEPYMCAQAEACVRMHHGSVCMPRASLALLFQK